MYFLYCFSRFRVSWVSCCRHYFRSLWIRPAHRSLVSHHFLKISFQRHHYGFKVLSPRFSSPCWQLLSNSRLQVIVVCYKSFLESIPCYSILYLTTNCESYSSSYFFSMATFRQYSLFSTRFFTLINDFQVPTLLWSRCSSQEGRCLYRQAFRAHRSDGPDVVLSQPDRHGPRLLSVLRSSPLCKFLLFCPKVSYLLIAVPNCL